MELVLMDADCSAIDMISILKKATSRNHFKAEVEGERVQVGEAKPLTFMLCVLFRRYQGR
jgi:putative redox protein